MLIREEGGEATNCSDNDRLRYLSCPEKMFNNHLFRFSFTLMHAFFAGCTHGYIHHVVHKRRTANNF